MCQAIGTCRNDFPQHYNKEFHMFLNPWYSGQPSVGGQTAAVVTNGDSFQSPEDGSHPTYSSDPGQDLIVEQADLTDEQLRQLSAVQQALRPGWTVHLTTEGRFYYCNHYNQTSGWLPPSDCWHSSGRLPYGWESAVDLQGKTYFVNHLNKSTTAEDPRKWESPEQDALTEPRTVSLNRDAEHGFGFVAGSEKPVIVRFVRSGGPSVDRLMPGDLILKINGEDVRQAPRDHVIQLIRDCQAQVTLEVCQPPLDNTSTRKSAILSAAKKTRLKSQPSRVRFAESVDIDGLSDHCRTSSLDSVLPLMPNVLKVFLENGQTKSFKYDTTTRVQDVINSLQAKLGLVSTVNFALVVEHVKSVRRNKFTILDPSEHLSKIASRPGVHNLRCLFRVTFYPLDAYDLLCQDPQAFEYLYLQCCNDVIHERFSPELKNEVALRLASLHMYQHSVSSNGPGSKVTVKTVEKEYGLERFVPASLADTMKKKEMQKLLGHFLKLNSSLLGPGQKQLTAIQAQLHYLKIISELPSYGAKCFSTNISDSNVESVILISPKFGISQINSLRNSVPNNLCDIEDVVSMAVTREDQVSQKIYIQLKSPEKDGISLNLETRDSDELILVLQGYYRLFSLQELQVEREQSRDENLIPYCSRHQVTCQGWNYPHNSDPGCLHYVNFGAHPPYQPPPPGLLLMDSDESSSLWSSSTETTNVDERSSLTDFQHNTKASNEPIIQWKKPSRFEVVLTKTAIDDDSLTATETDPNLNVLPPANNIEQKSSPHFSLCCNDPASASSNTLKKNLVPLDGTDNNDFSFGLHSPDSFPIELSVQKKDKSNLVSLDADLIDLTTIPPPSTPDEEKLLLSCLTPAPSELVETPPTPFADRLLEQELEKLRRDESVPNRNSTSHLAALYQLSDIESFIAKVTVPPPPDDTKPIGSNELNSSHQDFSGFIIPPPPPPRVILSSVIPLNQSKFSNPIHKVNLNNESMSTVSTSNQSRVSFSDRDVQEIKVAKETFFKEPKDKISPRIASIQKMLANPGGCHDDSVDGADKVKKSSPPPPPPRQGVVGKSSTNKIFSQSTAIKEPSIIKQSGPHHGFKLDQTLSRKSNSDSELPPSLPPRVSNPVKPVLPSPPDTEPHSAKPVLPSKTHRSLPKIPDPGTNPKQPPKPSDTLPSKPEKPQLPKKGMTSPVEHGRELLRSKSELGIKKPPLDVNYSHLKATSADLQLSPLKPRAVSGSPLRINQNSVREGPSQHHCFLQNAHNKKGPHSSTVTVTSNNSIRLTNGCKQMSDIELESGVDSDNENFESDNLVEVFTRTDSRTQLFEQAESVIVRVVATIERSQHICSSPIERETTPQASEAYQRAKEQLTNDSRQFVTASKLFVKSATENERQLLECLSHCVHLIDRIGTVTHEVALLTPTPSQTNGLLVKVKDVAETYLSTVRAAGQAAGKDLNDPSMDTLMKRATTLASVLTNLMRTLRVFA